MKTILEKRHQMDRLEDIFKMYKQQKFRVNSRFALFLIGLNNFQAINHDLGHFTVNELLKHAADRVQSCLRSKDTVKYLGRNKFLVIIEGLKREEEAIYLAHSIHKAFGQPIPLNEEILKINLNIGIVFNHPRYTHPKEMIRDSDRAMSEAKTNQLQYFVFRSNPKIYRPNKLVLN